MKRAAFVLLMLILLVGGASAQGPLTIDWFVIGGGGGHAEAAPYALDGTIGQAMVGVVSSASYELCSGFWCGAAAQYRVYLPLVLRNF